MSGLPQISVVIPTFNRQASLQRVVEALTCQSLSPDKFEVIIVSDGSTDGTDEYLRAAQCDFALEVETQANQGPAVARNRGVAMAKAPLVLYLDDDVIPSEGLLECHIKTHDRLGHGYVVIGTMSTPEHFDMSPWVSWEQRMLYKQYDAMAAGEWAATARQFYTGNASVERLEVVAAGGFDPEFRRGEDVELAYRLADRGLKFSFEPTAEGFHFAKRSFASWLANASDYGRNDVIFARDHHQAWLLDKVRSEYSRRDRLTRLLTHGCHRFPVLQRIAVPVLTQSVKVSGKLHMTRVNRVGLSALYNLAYYRGLSAELGGWNHFLDMAT